MRIFYAAGSRPHGSLTGSSIWDRNLRSALVSMGHEVIDFDYDLAPHYRHADPSRATSARFIAKQRPVLEAALLEQLTRAKETQPIDLFFSYFYAAFARPEVIRTIADMGIVTVNWYCNASYQFDLVSELAPAYSFSLVPEKFRLEDYRSVGACPVFCQEAANPDFYKPYDLAQDHDVVFVGTAYGDRATHLRSLLQADIDARAYGVGWDKLARPAPLRQRVWRLASQTKRRLLGVPLHGVLLPREACGGPLSDEDMVKMFSRSKITLGFSSVGDTGRSGQPVRQVRLRDFEVPMAGGFYMLEHCEEIEEFFVPGKEIVVFDGPDDLSDKVRYYLDHDQEREAIRCAGHERALRDHTWHKRLTDAFAVMGLGERTSTRDQHPGNTRGT